MMNNQQTPWRNYDSLRPADLLLDQVDVCIVGAGIAGITTAYCAVLEGLTVQVVDDSPVGRGETQWSSAHLSCALDDRYFELERIRGDEAAFLAAQSHRAAIDFIESAVREHSIDCQFQRVDGYLIAPAGGSSDAVEQEFFAAKRAGLDVERMARAPWPGLVEGPCLRFPQQGQIDPLRYVAELASVCRRLGGCIAKGHVTQATGGDHAELAIDGGRVVKADSIVIATNSPINDRFVMHAKQAPYTTYVAAFGIPSGAIPEALYWDTQDPYHYVRVADAPTGGSWLLVGGEDHRSGKTGDQEERFYRLQRWAQQRVPVLGEMRARWCGQVRETLDGLAYIGRNPADAENVYIATGDSGMGLTHGTIAGLLLTDLILDRANRWESLYAPSRKPTGAIRSLLRENFCTAANYTDWLTAGDVDSLDLLARESGAVIRDGFRKLAVYRDGDGSLSVCSAVCPHLHALVEWNESARTWDCPAHGSRFDCHGTVVNGPACAGLQRIDAATLEFAAQPSSSAAGESRPT